MSAEGLLDFVLLSKYEICSVLWGGLKLEGSNFVSLWPRRWISFEIEGQYHFRPSPDICSTCGDIVGVSQIVSPRPSLWNICVSWGPFRFCVHILFSLGLSFHTLDKICKEHIWSFDLQLCASILGALCASMLVPWFASIFEPLCIAWANIKFEVFRRGVPSYRGLIWFSCGLGGGFSWNWRAISFQTLPWYLFNLQWAPHKFYAGS